LIFDFCLKAEVSPLFGVQCTQLGLPAPYTKTY